MKLSHLYEVSVVYLETTGSYSDSNRIDLWNGLFDFKPNKEKVKKAVKVWDDRNKCPSILFGVINSVLEYFPDNPDEYEDGTRIEVTIGNLKYTIEIDKDLFFMIEN